jgi:hypothetical protein
LAFSATRIGVCASRLTIRSVPDRLVEWALPFRLSRYACACGRAAQGSWLPRCSHPLTRPTHLRVIASRPRDTTVAFLTQLQQSSCTERFPVRKSPRARRMQCDPRTSPQPACLQARLHPTQVLRLARRIRNMTARSSERHLHKRKFPLLRKLLPAPPLQRSDAQLERARG